MTAGPRRIQRRRTKGWRMPEGAVYVGRPSRWGNPYRVVGSMGGSVAGPAGGPLEGGELVVYSSHAPSSAAVTAAVDAFERDIDVPRRSTLTRALIRHELAGHDLACWCPLDQPCHADVLLRIANGSAT